MPNDGGVRAWYNSDGNWGAISAWAWGLSRIYDYLETDKDFDCKKAAVIGHSRLGKTDLWADPKGEWITAKMTDAVYALFGKKGLSLDKMPEADSPDNKGYVAYHIRTGKHTITAWDWEQYLEFAARHFK